MRRSTKTFLLAALLVTTVVVAEDEPEIVTKTRTELPEYKKILEELRGLKFTGDVKVKGQTDEGFRKFLESELDAELPQEKADAQSRAYARLGLLPEGYDIRKEMVEVAAGQAAAYYDPKQKTFFVLKTELPAAMMPQLVAHELHHALQDQHSDLRALYEGPQKAENEDALNAAKFLVEGEATYMMTLYEVKRQMPAATLDAAAGIVDQQLEMLAGMSREDLDRLERAQMGGNETMKKALDQRAKLPLFVYRSLVDPYMKGAALVAAVRKHGGWKAVDALWKDPPRSTSQVLRPGAKLIGDKREDPTEVDLADLSKELGEGWKRTLASTLGEMNLEILLKEKGDQELDLDKRTRPARGWIGDRVHAYEKGGKDPAVVWFLTWTQSKFATRFAGAYDTVLATKYPGSKAKKGELAGKPASIREEGGLVHATIASGTDVVVLEAVPAGSADAVAKAALAAKKTPSAKYPAKVEKSEK